MSRKSLSISKVIRRIPKTGLILFLALISLLALGFISKSYPYGYFNPHVIAFIAIALWSVALFPVLWEDIHIKRDRRFRIIRFVFVLFLICAAVAALVLKNPHYRIFYLFTILVFLLLLLVWKIYKSKKEQE
jgi:predicted permease